MQEDPRNDPEEAERLMRAAFLWGPRPVLTDKADDGMREFSVRQEADAARARAAEDRRLNEGRFFIAEAALLVAHQRGHDKRWQDKFAAAMKAAAENGELTVRDPSTWLPIAAGQRISAARIVTVADVNKWLEAIDAGYRWEQAPQAAEVTPTAPAKAEKGQGKVWTDERKAEARAYRKVHGLKLTAKLYGVSEATISKHLPVKKESTPVGYSVFKHQIK